jgi:hypothetical protein
MKTSATIKTTGIYHKSFVLKFKHYNQKSEIK